MLGMGGPCLNTNDKANPSLDGLKKSLLRSEETSSGYGHSGSCLVVDSLALASVLSHGIGPYCTQIGLASARD